MIRYMSIEEQVDKDFERVRRRAFLRRMRAWLRKDVCSDSLPSFEEARRVLGGFIQVPRGIRTVPVAKIVGSVGRTRDFDKAFLGDEYFVEDGNHRVSVARYQGVEMIDAEVVELLTRISPEDP